MKTINLHKTNLKVVILIFSLFLAILLSIITCFNFFTNKNNGILKPDHYKIKENGRWGFINKKGKIVISPEYEQVYDMYNGLAPVQVKGKWGFINKKGKFIVEPQYDKAASFSEGLAAVEKEGNGAILIGRKTCYRSPIPQRFLVFRWFSCSS